MPENVEIFQQPNGRHAIMTSGTQAGLKALTAAVATKGARGMQVYIDASSLSAEDMLSPAADHPGVDVIIELVDENKKVIAEGRWGPTWNQDEGVLRAMADAAAKLGVKIKLVPVPNDPSEIPGG